MAWSSLMVMIACYYGVLSLVEFSYVYYHVVPSLLYITLFWLRKTSVIVETYQLRFRVPFIRRSFYFFGKNFLFLFLFEVYI